MSFVDVRFLFFFPTVVALYILLPHRFRWVLLLLASYLFYMAYKPEYTLLLLAITIIDFVAGLAMGKDTNPSHRRLYLILSLVANLGILFVFKYFDFVVTSLAQVLHTFGTSAPLPTLHLLIPLGISFHIFQSMSYTIEVYKKRFEPVRHFGKFALYVSFFPQLAAGPIERPQGLLKQIMEDHSFDIYKARSGIKLMAWGFFKKLVVADNLAPLVNAAYANPSAYPGPSLTIATVLFAYQIYCDFSGYTDIARGAARVFGYELIPNFNRPFHAQSVADFWRRWHMSLTGWLRDYLYQPLAFSGKRLTQARIYWSLFITLVLIGLWHGANWTYVIFGALHGMYLVVESVTARFRVSFGENLGKLVRMRMYTPIFVRNIVVFTLVCISYVFFRSSSIHEAFYILTHIGSGVREFISSLHSLPGAVHVLTMDTGFLGAFSSIGGPLIGVVGIGIVELVEWLQIRGTLSRSLASLPHRWRLVVYSFGILFLLALGSFTTQQQFIYFQF